MCCLRLPQLLFEPSLPVSLRKNPSNRSQPFPPQHSLTPGPVREKGEPIADFQEAKPRAMKLIALGTYASALPQPDIRLQTLIITPG